MYNEKKLKQLMYDAYHVDLYDDEGYFEALKGILLMLDSKESLDAFADFMNTMTQEEYDILGGIIDEINSDYVSRKFTTALRKVIIKYPLDIPDDKRENEIEYVMLRAFERELDERGE